MKRLIPVAGLLLAVSPAAGQYPCPPAVPVYCPPPVVIVYPCWPQPGVYTPGSPQPPQMAPPTVQQEKPKGSTLAPADADPQVRPAKAEELPTPRRAEEQPENKVPKLDLPTKPDTPKVDVPKPETPKPEGIKIEPPKADVPKLELPKLDTPKPDAPKPDVPKFDAPKADSPRLEVPKLELPGAPAAPAGGKNEGPVPPIVLPPPPGGTTSESKYLTVGGATATVLPVPEPPATGAKRTAGFYNYTGRDLELTVDGTGVRLPARSYVTAAVAAAFTWKVGNGSEEKTTVPAGSAGVEVVLK